MIFKIGNRSIQAEFPKGSSLGAMLGHGAPCPYGTESDGVALCIVNGVPIEDWRSYSPKDDDRISITPSAGEPVSFFSMLISLALSLFMSVLQSLLAPKPKSPNTGKPKGGFGVAGLSNTIEEGTPKLVLHGTRRIFPHIIGSKTVVTDDGRRMSYRVLYLIGGTGGDGYEDVSAPEINEITIGNYPGTTWEWRSGTNSQTVVKGFENVEQTFSDGRDIPFQFEIQSFEIKGTPTAGTYTLTVPGFGTTSAIAFNATAATVQTKLRAISGLGSVEVTSQGTTPNLLFTILYAGTSGDIDLITAGDSLVPLKATITPAAILKGHNASGGPIVYSTKIEADQATPIFRVNAMKTPSGDGGSVVIKIEKKKTSEGAGSWAEVAGSPITWKDNSQAARFKSLAINFPSKDFWDIRFTLTKSSLGGGNRPVLFNVVETRHTTLTYPGNALAAINGIDSSQVKSLDSMLASFIVKGHKCKQPVLVAGVWDGSTYTNAFTNKRFFVLRCLLTHSKIGLGHRIPESFYDTAFAVLEQAYYDELVPGSNGDEVRDRCDHLLNDPRPGWDTIREDILGEARASLIPSGTKLKPVIDRPRTPGLLYSYPGNILDDTGGAVKTVFGTAEKAINTIRASFPDETDKYKSAAVEDQDPAIGADPVQPDSFAFDSVTRKSQVIREIVFIRKKAQLELRRHQWKSPMTARVSEPVVDWDYLSHTTIKNLHGWQGTLPSGSTTTQIVLPSGLLVTLLSGKTYEIILRHQKNNVVEKRTISTGIGTWGRVQVGSAFTTAPAKGDIFALGEQNIQTPIVKHESITALEDGAYQLNAVEVVSAVYDLPTLPGVTQLRLFGPESVPPIPLLDAAIAQRLVLNQDGTFSANLVADVTPGLPLIGGLAQSGAAGSIRLAADSPAIDDYFNSWRIKLTAGTGAGQERTVSDYNGSTKDATPDTNFSPAPDVTTGYEIILERFGIFDGFQLEAARDDTGDFEPVRRVKGTHFEIAGVEQGITKVYRFTPVSNLEVQNNIATWTKTITTVGDTTAPAAPASLTITGHLKTISIESSHTRPTELDFAGVEIEIWRDPKQNNLLTQPDAIDNAAWTKTNLTPTADQAAGPDGAVNAEKLLETTTNGEHVFQQTSAAFTADSQVVYGVFVAAGLGRDWVKLVIEDPASSSNNVSAIFDITGGVLGTVANAGNGSLAAASLERFINGMYYCRLTGKVGASPTTAKGRTLIGSSSTVFTYAGDVTKGIYGVGGTLKVGTLTTDLVKGNLRDAAPTDDAKTGTLVMRKSLPLDTEAYGTAIIARARSVDFTNNPSTWRNAPAAATLTQVVTGDVTTDAITQFLESATDGSASYNTTEIVLNSLSISTIGGRIQVIGKAILENLGGASRSITLRLRRGTDTTGTEIDRGVVEIGDDQKATIALIKNEARAAGAYDYVMTVVASGSGANNSGASFRRLSLEEGKK